METLVAVSILAAICTKLVDTIRNAIDPDDTIAKVVWNILAFGFGIALAFAFGLNLLQALGTGATADVAGQFLTGLSLGAWSSGMHELFDRLSPR